MKKIAVLVLVLFTATLTCASKLCVIGASCKQYELPGIYSLDKDCPHFLKLAPEKRYGHGWCNFSEKNAVICCIGASPVSTVSWKRPQVILNRFGEDCQYFGPNTYTIAVERIFGGMESSPGEFPHFAALGYDRKESELRFDCGGTLITDQHVLTAAHCVVSGRNRPSVVRLGSVNEILALITKNSCTCFIHRQIFELRNFLNENENCRQLSKKVQTMAILTLLSGISRYIQLMFREKSTMTLPSLN